jgi:virginiamycin B lyase
MSAETRKGSSTRTDACTEPTGAAGAPAARRTPVPPRGRARAWGAAPAVLALLLAAGAAPATLRAQAVGPGAASAAVTEFALPTGSRPFQLVAGPDGALWFTMPGGQCEDGPGNKVGRLTVDGRLTEYPLPTPRSYPGGLAFGPDGALWVGLQLANRVGRLTPDGRVTHEYPVPTTATARFPALGCEYPASRPAEGDLVVGPDGTLWFGESTGNNIARMTTDGVVTEYPIPTPNSNPIGLTVGPDGALWFVERMVSKIGRITTDGAITEFPIPTPGSFPNAIVNGPDGALWFSELMGDRIGRVTPDGAITEFPTPGVGPVGMALGPDGALWLAGFTSKEIVRVTTAGAITHRYPVPSAGTSPLVVAVGPDGNIWYTSQDGHRVGRVALAGAAAVPRALPRTGAGPPAAGPAAPAGALLLLGAAALILRPRAGRG